MHFRLSLRLFSTINILLSRMYPICFCDLKFYILLFFFPISNTISEVAHIHEVKEVAMSTNKKEICYFDRSVTVQETLRVTDCGYHETEHGHYSSQKIIDHYVLHCIVSGKGKYQIANSTYELSTGDCFLIPPHTPILYQSDIRAPWVYYWIGFDGANLSHLLELWGLSDSVPVLHYQEVNELENILKPLALSGEMTVSGAYQAIGQFYLLNSLLINNNTKNQSLTSKESYVRKAQNRIRDSYYQDINIRQLAEDIGLDRTYLSRIFKEVTGVSIKEYLDELRMNRAKYLLCHTDMSLSEIAYFCGYSSEPYFSIAFKKKHSLSPSQYRRNNRIHPEMV